MRLTTHGIARWLLLPVAVLVAGLAAPAPLANAQPAEPVTLNLAFTQDIAALDPTRLTPFEFDYDARDVVENLFVGLTAYDPDGASIEPAMATDWEISEDGLRWTFHLRDDVYWVRHNPITGATYALRPVTADDFVFGIQRVCNPLTASPYFTSIFVIDGCQVVYRTDPEFMTADFAAERVRVHALDDQTVEYTLLFPAAYFLTFTAMPEFRPLPREFVAHIDNWAETGSLVTNGPFVVGEWARNQQLTLLRNPYWPDEWTGNVERVVIGFTDPATALSQANAGQLDRAPVPPGALVQGAVTGVMRPSVVMLGFSSERAPMDQRGIRQALAWSIDREAMVAQILPGEGIAMTHFTPPGMIGAPPLGGVGAGYNPDAAREAFAVAGHAQCGAIPEQIEVMVRDDARSQAIAQFLVESWQRELGCNPGLFIITPASFRVVLANARDTFSDAPDYRRPHIWLASWTADYYDANNWLSDALHCRYGTFSLGAPCDETDALIDAAGVQYDAAERARMVAEIENRFFGAVGKYPIVPLYVVVQPTVQQPWLTAGVIGPARYDRWVIDTAMRGR
ncbi:MAG: peptide ABC transporter substrate-binding protein [Anaerolineae bacterium]